MKRLRIVSVLSLLVINSLAIADDKKNALIQEYIELSGLRATLIDTKKQEINNTENLAKQLLDILVQKNPELSVEHRNQAYKAYKDYAYRVATSYTVEDSISKWIELYGSRFSNTELEELLRFQKSEVGRKIVEVSLSGNREYIQYLNNKQSIGIKKAEPIMSKKITSIIDEHQTENMSFLGKAILYILGYGTNSSDTGN